jgi:hypothetical protein
MTPSGRALKAAMDEFWTETGPLLADEALACPESRARWFADRAELLKEIEAEDSRRQGGKGRTPGS